MKQLLILLVFLMIAVACEREIPPNEKPSSSDVQYMLQRKKLNCFTFNDLEGNTADEPSKKYFATVVLGHELGNTETASELESQYIKIRKIMCTYFKQKKAKDLRMGSRYVGKIEQELRDQINEKSMKKKAPGCLL